MTTISLSDKEKLLKFLYSWRERIVNERNPYYSNLEEFGKLLAINTIIYYVENNYSA